MLFKRYLMNTSSLFVLQVVLRDHPPFGQETIWAKNLSGHIISGQMRVTSRA